MITWLIVAILAYLFFGLASFCDKLVLSGTVRKAPQPKAYTFYVGVFGLFVILLIPFVKFSLPGVMGFVWIILDAVVHVVGLYAMYVALGRFDVSKVIATIGATQPIFIFILTWIFWGPQTMSGTDILAFIMLIVGSAVISVEKTAEVTGDFIKITIFSSLMFSFDYVFLKFVFINQAFLSGVIWIGIFIFLVASTLLLKKSSRKEIFEKKIIRDKKTQTVFLGAQVFGGGGNLLQSFAIALSPIAFLATVNSLRGIQYVFLFLMTLSISRFYPKILKEELSRKIIFQKVISIFLIATGLGILVF